MSKTVVEVSTLKLHVAAGSVWYLDGAGLPTLSGSSVDAFMASTVLHRSGRVRLPLCAANSLLLARLVDRVAEGFLESLEVCSPLVCESAEDRKDPELVLYYMRTFAAAPSLGGWRAVTLADFLACCIAARIDANHGVVDHDSILAAERHPVWPALTFVGGLDDESATALIGLILDPRCYIDPDQPDRISRLEQFLGLNPRTSYSVSRGRVGSWLEDRCRLILHSWQGNGACGRLTGAAREAMLADPHNFLWRIWTARDGSPKGDLAGSKHFVSYLRHNWLNEVAGPSSRGRLFVPEHFFARPDEVDAYQDHMRLVRRMV